MHEFPHTYSVSANTKSKGDVALESAGVPVIQSQAPAEFGGPGDRWSPESLLVAAVADCFALSFRAIAGASRLEFDELDVEVDGTLDNVDRKMSFTGMTIHASVSVGADIDQAKVERLLHKAEQSCLITNSLNCEAQLTVDVITA